ncbi:hypothetical protein Barb4_01216 [Bacteroidales bacterium Barb4]|nr:hypothetical protein Barb4_01216 [Bacteroidales bacterium Barb4]
MQAVDTYICVMENCLKICSICFVAKLFGFFRYPLRIFAGCYGFSPTVTDSCWTLLISVNGYIFLPDVTDSSRMLQFAAACYRQAVSFWRNTTLFHRRLNYIYFCDRWYRSVTPHSATRRAASLYVGLKFAVLSELYIICIYLNPTFRCAVYGAEISCFFRASAYIRNMTLNFNTLKK